MATATGALNTNTRAATAAEVTLTKETTLSLYICPKTGNDGKYRVVLEVSPDNGANWMQIGSTLSERGMLTEVCAATKARAKVEESQGEASTVTVFLVAS